MSDAVDTGATCVTCGQQLIYSIPAQKTDTTTKKNIDDANYRCVPCKQAMRRKKNQEREEKQQTRKQTENNIKQRIETQTETFDRLWHDIDENGELLNTMYNDSRIVSLPNQTRLMAIYKIHKLTRSELGFQAYEEANVVFRPEIEMIMHRYRQAIQQLSIDVGAGRIKRQDEPREAKEIENAKTTALKKVIRRMEKMHSDANKDELMLPVKERQRMVTDPGYKEYGKRVPRYHLLYNEEVYLRRQAKRDRQVDIITEASRIEKEISDKNQKRLFDDGQGAIA